MNCKSSSRVDFHVPAANNLIDITTSITGLCSEVDTKVVHWA